MMQGILEKIVAYKRLEVDKLKAVTPVSLLQKDYRLNLDSRSMSSAILNGSGVIAEFKRASPSKGLINDHADVRGITKGYVAAGASAVSILTDQEFFKAQTDDLKIARSNISIPILRKDFIIDPYQIYQAKIMGADCILLIAAILDPDEIKDFIKIASDIGLEAIIEVHNKKELDKLSATEKIIGINNRNLDSFEVDIENSLVLAKELGDVVKITESGLDLSTDLASLIKAGYDGFLVGENFMKQDYPDLACKYFVNTVTRYK